jgi:DNA-binding beta-propeller fold protein YncE
MKRNKFISSLAIATISLSALVFTGCKDDEMVITPPTPITTSGVVTTFAGSGAFGSSNGAGTAASFSYPNALAIDAAGTVYVADQGNNMIRKITAAGVVSVLSGTLASGSGNATAIGAIASYNGPTGVALDATASNLYVADFGNNTIRKIVLAAGPDLGKVTTYAGVSGNAGNNDNVIPATATAAAINPRFSGPAGLAVDVLGNVYVADYTNNRIRKISPLGVITTVAGSTLGNADGVGAAAKFNGPRALALDATGTTLYVADANNNTIRKIEIATGGVTTLAGNGQAAFADGNGAAAAFNHPSGIAIDLAGNLYVADAANNLLRKVTPAGAVTSVAGSGFVSLITPFNSPSGVAAATDATGVTTIYVANTQGNLIQKVK